MMKKMLTVLVVLSMMLISIPVVSGAVTSYPVSRGGFSSLYSSWDPANPSARVTLENSGWDVYIAKIEGDTVTRQSIQFNEADPVYGIKSWTSTADPAFAILRDWSLMFVPRTSYLVFEYTAPVDMDAWMVFAFGYTRNDGESSNLYFGIYKNDFNTRLYPADTAAGIANDATIAQPANAAEIRDAAVGMPLVNSAKILQGEKVLYCIRGDQTKATSHLINYIDPKIGFNAVGPEKDEADKKTINVQVKDTDGNILKNGTGSYAPARSGVGADFTTDASGIAALSVWEDEIYQIQFSTYEDDLSEIMVDKGYSFAIEPDSLQENSTYSIAIADETISPLTFVAAAPTEAPEATPTQAEEPNPQTSDAGSATILIGLMASAAIIFIRRKQ